MTLHLGNTELNKLYVGPNEVQRVYQGSVQVWPGDTPEIVASSALSGRTLVITVDSVNTELTSAISLTQLTRNGVDVLGEQVDAATPPQMAATTSPGTVNNGGVIVSAATETLDVGSLYLVQYTVTSSDGLTLFFPSNNGSPFVGDPPPSEVGTHSVLVTAQDTDMAALMRTAGAAGSITISHFSVRKASWSYIVPGSTEDTITWELSFGDSVVSGTTHVPADNVFYVSGSGSDSLGTGASAAPFRQPSRAMEAAAGPGDTIYLLPGVYDPFSVTKSGTNGNPFIIRTPNGQVDPAIIRGDLQRHTTQGGSGVTENTSMRDGVYLASQKYVDLRGFEIEWVYRTGVFIIGDTGTATEAITVDNVTVRNTGAAGITAFGRNPSTVVPLDHVAEVWTSNIVIENCDVSTTNLGSDFSAGVSEAISVAALASNVTVRNNDVHDTNQYGIDFKAGVDTGAIYGNRIWNIERYGIYLDAGRRFVRSVNIYNNEIWSCRNGIVLAREAAATGTDYATEQAANPAEFIQELSDIDVYNNRVWSCSRIGFYAQRHPQDGPDGMLVNIRIRFNTFHDNNREGGYRDIRLDWGETDTVADISPNGIDFIGNIVSSDRVLDILDTWTVTAGFTVTNNLLDGTDPLYTDETSANFAPIANSPAGGIVNATYLATPFALDAVGIDRTNTRTAGALTGATPNI